MLFSLGSLLVLTLILFKGVPSGFVPEEDNGYFLVNVMLPDASSLQRTDLACKKIEQILANEKSIDNLRQLPDIVLLQVLQVQMLLHFLFHLKPWEERTEKEEISFAGN